jgi:hypothetical protein
VASPFGFMAFLGMASPIAVIVSHLIVLFDVIEEMHAEGKPLEEALLDAGHRPPGASAHHGGGNRDCAVPASGARRALTAATFVTLIVVPVRYAIFVLDLKLVKWDERHAAPAVEIGAAPVSPVVV